MNGMTTVPRDIAARIREISSTFGLAEWILYALSKDPKTHFRGEDASRLDHPSNVGDPLKTLLREFPDLSDIIRGKRVLDYGCGDGYQSAAFARMGAAEVLGVDIMEERIAFAREQHQAANLRFGSSIEGTFDIAISQNSFEHFPKPQENMREIRNALRPGGLLLLTFCPPWYAPYGSHITFTTCPWVNILFSEKTVFLVRQLYREDDYMGYNGVNKMTVGRFEQIIADSGFKLIERRYTAVKNLPLVTRIAGLRELLTNVVTCILEKTSEGAR